MYCKNMNIEIASSKGTLFPKLLIDQEEKLIEATEADCTKWNDFAWCHVEAMWP